MRRPNGKNRFPLAILALISLVAWTSCATCPKSDAPASSPPPLPAIRWPTFPDPSAEVARDADGSVRMSLAYWLAVTRYVIDVEAGIEIVEAYRGSQH